MDTFTICSCLQEKETGSSCYSIIEFGEDGKDAELKQDATFKVEEYVAKKKRLWAQFETHTHRHTLQSPGVKYSRKVKPLPPAPHAFAGQLLHK